MHPPPPPLQYTHTHTCLLVFAPALVTTVIAEANSEIASIFKNIGMSIPGIDEISTFTQVMKFVKSMDHDITVFDTAPTGHTLRLLQMPETVSKAIGMLKDLDSNFGGMLGQVRTTHRVYVHVHVHMCVCTRVCVCVCV